MPKTVGELKVEGYPETKININGWDYVRMTDSLANALFNFLYDYSGDYSEVRQGERTATAKDICFAQIDRELLGSHFINEIENLIGGTDRGNSNA